MSRVLDANQLELGNIVATSQTWTDYDGDTAYADYSLAGSPPVVTPLKSYEPGLGQVESGVDEGGDDTFYQLTDHLGSVRVLSNVTEAPFVSPEVYTAFGERIASTDYRRYGYVGAHGYQSHSIPEATDPDKAFPFLHVGARYYDPSTGRFLQRDPIGIDGGPNSYIYVMNVPTGYVDPEGLFWALPDWMIGPICGPGLLRKTGGDGTTFLDKWGNRVGNRGVPTGPSSGAGLVVNLRRTKGVILPGQTSTTNVWASLLRRGGLGGSANVVQRGAPWAVAIGGLIDTYFLAKEGIYAYYDIPPGCY